MSEPVISEADVAGLLREYDAHLRAHVPDPLPEGGWIETDGPVLRFVGIDRQGFVTYRDLAGLDGAALDALIARQRDFFAARGEGVEWKLHGHDRPASLPGRLVAAGFAPEDRETVVVGLAGPLATAALTPPDGVLLREVTADADLARIADMESQVWGEDRDWLVEGLSREIAADPESITVVVAEAGEGSCRPAGCGMSQAPGSRRCGAGRRWPRGAAGASTRRWWPTGRGSRWRAATGSCRWTRRTTAGPSSSGSASWRSRRRPPTCGRRRMSRRPHRADGVADAVLAQPSAGAQVLVRRRLWAVPRIRHRRVSIDDYLWFKFLSLHFVHPRLHISMRVRVGRRDLSH
ncbi:hypothetical protein ACFQX7_08185 [Luedemannella flava]